MSATFSHGVVSESQKADLPAVAGAAGYPNGPRQGMIAVGRQYPCAGIEGGDDIGPLCNFDTWVGAPAAWADVTFSLRARTQDVWAELDVTTLADAQHVIRANDAAGNAVSYSGLLFEWRGDPADEFAVYAFNTAVSHAGVNNMASFIGRGWGRQSGREVVNPYAPLRREQHSMTTTVAGFPGPAVAMVAPLSGRSLYVTSIEITHDQAAVQLCQISYQVPGHGAVVIRSWFVSTNGLVQTFPKPLRLPPGAQLLVTGTAAATVIFDISATQD